MDLETMNRFWQRVCELTAGLEAGRPLSTPQLVEYINQHLPQGAEKMTKTKVNYLHSNKILNPQTYGAGSERKSWRYGKEDIRRVLLVELLKTERKLSVKEIKGWLQSLSDTQPRTISETPTPASSAYPLLRNRAIGALVTTISGQAEKTIPTGCLIALRLLKRPLENWRPGHLSSWEEVREVLSDKSWNLAEAHSSQKLYVYSDLEQLFEFQSEIKELLPKYQWQTMTLEDSESNCYGLILGVPERETKHPLIEAIINKNKRLINEGSTFQLKEHLGLTTLLKASFMIRPEVGKGAPLSTLVEIIAQLSDAWEYSAILAPDSDGELVVKECSAKFPAEFRGKKLQDDQFFTEWCYHFGQELIVEPTVEGDPRIPGFGDQRQTAVAAAPAVTKVISRNEGRNQKPVGVLYTARREQLPEKTKVISEELKAGLKALGYVCADLIAREQVERGTIEEMSRFFISGPTSHQALQDPNSLLQKVANLVHEGVSPGNAPRSWVYLLTLNIQILGTQQDPSQKNITEWICRQAAEVTKNFLANRLFGESLPVELCEMGTGRFAFAILRVVNFAETKYKAGLRTLAEQLGKMSFNLPDQTSSDSIPIKFYPRHVTFRYEQLRRDFVDHQTDNSKLTYHLVKITTESLQSSPYIFRGNEALRESNLNLAVSEYQDALRYAPNNYYVHKHLAEARWLQGDLERAIEHCRKALELDAQYASAHCLLADCLSYQGRYGEALEQYEETLKINRNRPDFLIRYGIALASMTPSQYRQAREALNQRRRDLTRRNFQSEPYLEAIEKFESAFRASEAKLAGSEQETIDTAKYHYYKGYAYLQAYQLDKNVELLNKAIEDFNFARRQKPDDLQLSQAYSYAVRLKNDRQSVDSTSKEERTLAGSAQDS